MRVRLGYAMELVVVVASGLGLARWVSGQPLIQSSAGSAFFEYRLRCFVEPLLAGAALVGGLGLASEVARRRSPRPWGVGRWTWSAASLTIALRLLDFAVFSGLRAWRRGGAGVWQEVGRGVAINGAISLTSMFTLGVGWTFAAAWITSRVAGGPVDPAPDARERAGCLLLAGIVTWTVTYHALLIVS